MKTDARGAARGKAAASLWHEHAFRAVWVGQTVSLLGDHVTRLALPWPILHALPAGVVADRVNRVTRSRPRRHQ